LWWLLYPPTRHVPPKLSVLIQYLADKLAAEPTLFKLK
ncbi:transcriptional regulator, partial [Acinetobacter baumannii]